MEVTSTSDDANFPNDWQNDRDEDFDDRELECITCLGEGWVESVVHETNRYGWDDDAPGPCPNCGGSGFRKDQRYW